MTEQEMRDLFREMRDEPVPADSLARVRARLANRAPRRHWWILVPAAAVALSIVSVVMFRPAPPPIPGPVIVAKTAPPPVKIAPVQIPPRPKRARPKPVAAVPVSMIRIETPDPEVVILLVN